ncbi:MAG: glycosyltransferase family 2 protein [Lachnospiraceae bacterium]|nr:glycosyltransferase family 2 protein [Lachnospiraceae bacterium]
MNQKVLVIIPAYNEAENIQKVVDGLIANYPQYDYVIINDSSKDETAAICRKNNYSFVSLPVNLGIGGGVQTGYKYALEHDYDIAVQHDGDGQHDPAYIERVIQPILDGQADIAIGSRFLDREGFQSSAGRRAGIKFLSVLIRLCCGARVKDVTSGFRAVNKKYIRFYAEEYPSDYPEPEAIVTASLDGARIREVPVVMRERENGVSSINLKRSVYYMVKVSIAIVICRMTRRSKTR